MPRTGALPVHDVSIRSRFGESPLRSSGVSSNSSSSPCPPKASGGFSAFPGDKVRG